MPDLLYDAITRAIDQRIDGDRFERCAVDLLREYYPTLRAVDGGSDAGMDGLGQLPNGEQFFLISTVRKDVRRNLEQNIQSYLNAGGDLRVAVFATTRSVSGQLRISLRRDLQEHFGVRLADVHDRGEFVRLLHRNPRWRRDLLGVAGEARALTRLPATRRPTPEVPLIGREDDLEYLRNVVGDLVLVGKPGIGKTFLLQKLMDADWGLFDAGWDEAQLEDAIREFKPRRVVLDDAHLNEGRIAALRRLRQAMSATFDIVAVSWPGYHEQVASVLPGSSRYEVLELDRGQILKVIQEVGIDGPRELQARIVEQALGRAGLAVTLADACISGNVRDVAVGDTLLNDVVGWFSRSLGQEARCVLGMLALTGNGGATIGQVAKALSLSVPKISELVHGLASGGTIDEVPRDGAPGPLRVQPEILRYALVRDVFYGGPAALDVTEVIAHLDRPSDALLPLIGAAHRGARVNRQLLRSLLDLSNWAAAADYASLGPSETDEALQIAPHRRALIARDSYERDLSPERTLRVLMELAVGDRREEHSNPDHPLRLVGDRLKRPDEGIDARRMAVAVADQWLRDGGDQEVGLRVLMHAIYPGTSRSYTDPGLGRTVTMAEAVLPLSMIDDLSRLWELILEIVERERPTALANVLLSLHPWVYPQILVFGRGPDETTGAAIREVAARVISRLADIFSERPGALRQLSDYASSGRLAVTIAVPPEFDAMFPDDWNGADEDGGYEGWARRADETVQKLAGEFERLPVTEIAARIADAETEAASAQINHPRYTPRLTQLLAKRVPTPETLLEALEQYGVAGDILLPVLVHVVMARSRGWAAAVERLLSTEVYFWVALQVVLTQPVGAQLKDVAIGRMTARYSRMIDGIVVRGEVDLATIVCLLNAPDPLVARATAMALAMREGDSRLSVLPESAQRRWREVIVQNPADDYWYSVILGRDPELFVDWLKAWFDRLPRDTVNHERVPRLLKEAIGQLPVDVRIQLIRAVPSDAHAFDIADVVTCLVSGDLEVAVALLDREDLQDVHGAILIGGPSESWMKRALLALERGWGPARIVAPPLLHIMSWSGEESLHWQSKIDAFMHLRQVKEGDDPRRERIIAAGIEYYERMRDTAAAGELRERIFGR